MPHFTPLTVSEEIAAEMLGVTPRAVAALVEEGELQVVKIGPIERILFASIEEFLFSQLSPIAAQRIRDHFESMGRRSWWTRLADESRRVKLKSKTVPSKRRDSERQAASSREATAAGAG